MSFNIGGVPRNRETNRLAQAGEREAQEREQADRERERAARRFGISRSKNLMDLTS